MNKVLKIILAIVAVLIIGGLIAYNAMSKSAEKQLDQIQISDVDLTQVVDGVYEGSYETTLVSAKVEVTVKNHKITNINIIKHANGNGSKAEAITDTVIQKQSLKTDVISGATMSSKVILKAIENALNSGINK